MLRQFPALGTCGLRLNFFYVRFGLKKVIYIIIYSRFGPGDRSGFDLAGCRSILALKYVLKSAEPQTASCTSIISYTHNVIRSHNLLDHRRNCHQMWQSQSKTTYRSCKAGTCRCDHTYAVLKFGFNDQKSAVTLDIPQCIMMQFMHHTSYINYASFFFLIVFFIDLPFSMFTKFHVLLSDAYGQETI